MGLKGRTRNASSVLAGALITTVATFCFAQSNSTAPPDERDSQVSDLFDMSLEELMTVKIETASKKEESVFDSPLSATVITREEIRRSGSRTIMEALRLAPGLIVREQTVGNYDIHIRGLDNVPPHRALRDFSSMTILVMIDYRVVYNYFQGGTFWETLPVDVHDVDRIEIIRGPVAAMYGPNAVSGVINIITSAPKKEGFYTRERAEYGPLGDERILGASAGYKWEKVSALLSGNYHHADRTQTSYYGFRDQQWYDEPADIRGSLTGGPLTRPYVRYPRLDLATDRFGLSGFLGAKPTEKIELNVSSGYQNSRSQKIYLDNLSTPLTTNDSQTWYADALTTIYDVRFHVSYLGGHQMTPRGTSHYSYEVNEYDLHVLDAEVEYDLSLLDEKLSIRPGAAFRRAQYNGALLAEKEADEITPSEKGSTLTALSASLRSEYSPIAPLRFIAAVRLDHYPDRTEESYIPRTEENLDPTTPLQTQTREGKKNYLSWQLSTSYKITEDHLIRVSYSRAYRAPFLVDTYLNDSYAAPTSKYGNRALELMSADAVELGYRSRFNKELQADIEVFGSRNKDFSEIYLRAIDYGPPVRFYYQYHELDTVAFQAGVTASLSLLRRQFQGKIFGTIQETYIQNHAPNTSHFFDYEHDPNEKANQVDVRHVGTPEFYGGFYANAMPIAKLNVNLSGYYYTRHTQIRADSTIGIMKDARYVPSQYDVPSKLILNAKASYDVGRELSVYVSGHNLLALERPEFAWADKTQFAVMVGADYGF